MLSSAWFWCCSMMHKSWASLTSRIPLVSRIKNWQEHWALQSLACGEVRGSPKGVILIFRLIIILGFQYAASLIVTCRVIVFLTLILFQCPKGLSEGVVYNKQFGWGGAQDLLFEINTCFFIELCQLKKLYIYVLLSVWSNQVNNIIYFATMLDTFYFVSASPILSLNRMTMP